jgi:uncharacterized membrane protein YgcG
VPLWSIPLIILGVLLLLVGTVALLSRIQGGRFIRPVVQAIAKVPFMRRQLMKASTKAIERDNPDLASAMRKVERAGAPKTPQQAQQLMSRFTPGERRAYMAAVGEQGAMPEPANRAQRRAMEKLQAGGPPPASGAGKKSGGSKSGGSKSGGAAKSGGSKAKGQGKSAAGGKSGSRKKR